jgi:tRNA (adenine57-N1/adenine58-N1)-methyltransferase
MTMLTIDILTQEVLMRTHELAPPPLPNSAQLQSVSDIVDKLRAGEQKKEERRVQQMRTAREKAQKQKEAREQAEVERVASGVTRDDEEDGAAGRLAKRKFEDVDLDITPLSIIRRARPIWSEHKGYPEGLVLTKPSPEMRGHTSYLTFASYYPQDIRQQLEQTKPRMSRLNALREREGSIETSDYGSEGLDEVMKSMTEEEMLALGV